MYDKELIDEISKRADIVTVVGSYLNLVKKGKLYYAICPFHDDSNPSLQIDPNRNTFRCWVDGHSGNSISFVMQYEKLSFIDAVKKVAQIIGFDDPRLHETIQVKKIDENLVPLMNCINDLNAFYEYALFSVEGTAALDYLKTRDITPEIIKKFHIGFSLSSGEKTINYLKSKGHSLRTIERIGILSAKSNKEIDSNSGRIIFAIADNYDQVVGFSARKFIEEDNGPKYINSPETELFTKGNVLYNYFNAKETARADKYIYILEGFMDVIALAKININSAVALMGLALSEYQINLIKKLNVEVRLCLDGDNPGQIATMSILPILLKHSLNVRIVNSQGNQKDADEILKANGAEGLRSYLNNLMSPFDFYIHYYRNIKKLITIEEKENLIKNFVPLLLALKTELELDDYINKLGEVTGFANETIRNYLKKVRAAKTNKTVSIEESINVVAIDATNLISSFHPEKKELIKIAKAEGEILYHMLNNQDAIMYYKETNKEFYLEDYRNIANALIEYFDTFKRLDISCLISSLESTEIPNKDELIKIVNNLTEDHKSRLPYSRELISECFDSVDEKKKKLNYDSLVAKAISGKTDDEKARIYTDALLLRKKESKN